MRRTYFSPITLTQTNRTYTAKNVGGPGRLSGMFVVFCVFSMRENIDRCSLFPQNHAGEVLDTLWVVGSSPMPPIHNSFYKKDLNSGRKDCNRKSEK